VWGKEEHYEEWVSKPSNRSKAFRDNKSVFGQPPDQFQNLLTGLRHSGDDNHVHGLEFLAFQNLLTGLRHSGEFEAVLLNVQDVVSKPSNRSKAFRVFLKKEMDVKT